MITEMPPFQPGDRVKRGPAMWYRQLGRDRIHCVKDCVLVDHPSGGSIWLVGILGIEAKGPGTENGRFWAADIVLVRRDVVQTSKAIEMVATGDADEDDQDGEESDGPPFIPGDRVRFRDTTKSCHRAGVHFVKDVEMGGQSWLIYLVGLQNDRRSYTAGQFTERDFVLVSRQNAKS